MGLCTIQYTRVLYRTSIYLNLSFSRRGDASAAFVTDTILYRAVRSAKGHIMNIDVGRLIFEAINNLVPFTSVSTPVSGEWYI